MLEYFSHGLLGSYRDPPTYTTELVAFPAADLSKIRAYVVSKLKARYGEDGYQSFTGIKWSAETGTVSFFSQYQQDPPYPLDHLRK